MNSLNSSILFPFLYKFPIWSISKICFECTLIVNLILKLIITIDQLHKFEIKKVYFNEDFEILKTFAIFSDAFSVKTFH